MSQGNHDHDHDSNSDRPAGIPVVVVTGHDTAGRETLIEQIRRGAPGEPMAIVRSDADPGESSDGWYERLLTDLRAIALSGECVAICCVTDGTELVLPVAAGVQDHRLDGLVWLAGIVAVVDVERFQDAYGRAVDDVDDEGNPATRPYAPIIVEQTESASVIVLNRTARAAAAITLDVEGYLRELNRDARFIRLDESEGCDWPDWLKALLRSGAVATGAVFGEPGRDGTADAAVDESGYSSFVYAAERPFAWNAFAAMLEDWPDEVRRCRGFVIFADHAPALLSIVRDSCEITVLEGAVNDDHDHVAHDHVAHDHPGLEDDDHSDHDHGQEGDEAIETTELTFIGRLMPTDAIVARLDACLAAER